MFEGRLEIGFMTYTSVIHLTSSVNHHRDLLKISDWTELQLQMTKFRLSLESAVEKLPKTKWLTCYTSSIRVFATAFAFRSFEH